MPGWEKERVRCLRRYLSRAAAKKFRTVRFMRAAMCCYALIYLFTAGYFKDLLFSVREEHTVEFRQFRDGVGQETPWQETFRITFRLSTGEIVFSREREEERKP